MQSSSRPVSPTSRCSREFRRIRVLLALALVGCSSPTTSDSTRKDNESTTTQSQEPTTSTSVLSAEEVLHATRVATAEKVVASWTKVLEQAATLVSLPPKTSPGGQPIIYDNGCHLGWNATKPTLCEFGDLTSDITVVVTGDSHAAHWFGAFEKAATEWGWRLVTVTKRGCPAADVQVYKSPEDGTDAALVPYTACDAWRKSAQKFIRALKPAVVVFPMLTRRGVMHTSGAGTAQAWRDGLLKEIDAITKGTSTKVLILSNTPKTIGAPIPSCLWSHPANIKRCENKTSVASQQKYVDNLAETAKIANVAFVDVTPWMCTPKICPVVVKRTMVYRDSHHLSDKFSRMLSNHVALEIDSLLRTPASPTTTTSLPSSSSTTSTTITSPTD